MNYSAIELAISVIEENLATEKDREKAREFNYGLFGLTANGMTPGQEKELEQMTFKDGYSLDNVFRRTELRKGQNLATFMDWAKDKNVYFVNNEEFDELYDEYLASLGA